MWQYEDYPFNHRMSLTRRRKDGSIRVKRFPPSRLFIDPAVRLRWPEDYKNPELVECRLYRALCYEQRCWLLVREWKHIPGIIDEQLLPYKKGCQLIIDSGILYDPAPQGKKVSYIPCMKVVRDGVGHVFALQENQLWVRLIPGTLEAPDPSGTVELLEQQGSF